MRPVPAAHRANPELFPEVGGWVDCFALDSPFDYDPVWRRCVELKVAVNCHGGQVPNTTWNGRSMSNFCFNHIGNMALQQHGICKSLLMGGVTRRFPDLQFGFLECGVGWACNLYSDLIGHWKKRNVAMLSPVPPTDAENAERLRLFREYGGSRMNGLLGTPGMSLRPTTVVNDPVLLDEWRALDIRRAEEFKPLFTDTFNFGCEADDPMTAWAFNAKVNPFGATLKVMLSSDLGHWDTPNMAEVVEEAYEAVERGLLTEDQFRDFAFLNVASMHLKMNPDFFIGTSVEGAAGRLKGSLPNAHTSRTSAST
jgi:hypothetical protein